MKPPIITKNSPTTKGPAENPYLVSISSCECKHVKICFTAFLKKCQPHLQCLQRIQNSDKKIGIR